MTFKSLIEESFIEVSFDHIGKFVAEFINQMDNRFRRLSHPTVVASFQPYIKLELILKKTEWNLTLSKDQLLLQTYRSSDHRGLNRKSNLSFDDFS